MAVRPVMEPWGEKRSQRTCNRWLESLFTRQGFTRRRELDAIGGLGGGLQLKMSCYRYRAAHIFLVTDVKILMI